MATRKRATKTSGGKPPKEKADWKPIMNAAFCGDVVKVKAFLKAGADPNILSRTTFRHRPLHRAIELKKTFARSELHEQVVKALIDGGADVKMRAMYDVTPLQLAAMGEIRFVPMLLKAFGPLDFFHAVVVADEKRVGALLKNDKSLAKAPDVNGWMALHYCAGSAMYRAGAKQNAALVKIAKMLIDAGADVMAVHLWDGKWPLPVLYHCCGQQNNALLARVLFEAGATPYDGETVYHAADEGHAECLEVIEEFADPKKLAEECSRAIPNLFHWGRSRGAKWLLEHGANPNRVSPEYGQSAFHAAVEQGSRDDVLKLLIKYGADTKHKTADGKTAMDLACAGGNKRVIQVVSTAK